MVFRRNNIGASCALFLFLLGAFKISIAMADEPQRNLPGSRVDSNGWNGYLRFRDILAHRFRQVSSAEGQSIGSLDPEHDAIVVLRPLRALPDLELRSFLQRGGRVALLDEDGTSQSLLDAFQIERSTQFIVATPPADDRIHLPEGIGYAHSALSHPLSQSIDGVVLNRATSLRHTTLSPIFRTRADETVLFAGAVGLGRLVVGSDSSLTTNGMLEFEPNHRFAETLASYMAAEDHEHKLLILEGMDRVAESPIRGSKLEQLLVQLSRTDIPTYALLSIAAFLGFVLCFVVATMIPPRKSPYRAESMAMALGLPTPIAQQASTGSSRARQTQEAEMHSAYTAHELRQFLAHRARLSVGLLHTSSSLELSLAMREQEREGDLQEWLRLTRALEDVELEAAQKLSAQMLDDVFSLLKRFDEARASLRVSAA